MQATFNISITIMCDEDNESGFELSLDEVVKKIKSGYTSGKDGNEDEEYFFDMKKRTAADTPNED